METAAFLSYGDLFDYLEATPKARCIKEGQAVLNAKHLITCGVTAKVADQIKIFALCLQTSALTEKPHEIKGTFRIGNNANVAVVEFLCSCKAGKSGRCKYIAAVLFLSVGENIMELPLLSSTDLTCYWTKARAGKPYNAGPILVEQCLAPKVLPPPKVLTACEANEVRNLFASVTGTTIGKHCIGRRVLVANEFLNPAPIPNLDKVLQKCANFNLLDQLLPPSCQNDCCVTFYNSLCDANVENIASVTKSDRDMWNLERQFPITGSRCYEIFTYSFNNWEMKAQKYFWPKSFKSKYTDYGIINEGPARAAYLRSNGYTVVETALIISQKQPWLAYTPDGIVFQDDNLVKLLEIKCPYVGKDVSAIHFINKCNYLVFNSNRIALKKKHKYYGQVQLGMVILNLPETDLVLYSSYAKNFITIIVPYDEPFLKMLLERLHHNYFKNMIHKICTNKNDI